MIESYLKNMLAAQIPSLKWSINYYTASDKTGTVYYSGGPAPDTYDAEIRYPQYQMFIRHSNFYQAEQLAQKTFDLLHKNFNFYASVNLYDEKDSVIGLRSYYVFSLLGMSEPLRLGVTDGLMEYSINFQAILREVK